MALANPVEKPGSVLTVAPSSDFDAIYSEHLGFVWRCLRGLGVAPAGLEDAAQDVFVIVLRRMDGFRGESSLRTWLYGIVRRVAANRRRSYRRRPDHASLADEPPSSAPGPHEQALEREASAFVQSFVAELEEPKRDIFVLALVEQLSVPEVADVLQIPLNTAYSRVRKVRLDFQRALHGKVTKP